MFFVAKTSHPPKLRHSQKRKQQTAQKQPGGNNRRFSHRILANGRGVRHPVRKRWWGVWAGFDRIYRINRIEGDGRNAEGAKKGIP